MTKVLMVAHQYGPPYAEGICSERVAKALVSSELCVQVVSSNNFTSIAGRQNFETLIGLMRWRAPIPNWRWVQQLTKEDFSSVDIVYGRGLPLDGLVAASAIARKVKVPLLLHFSDPLPCPWYGSYRAYNFTSKTAVKRLLQEAHSVSFTTEETLEYMQRVHNIDITNKAYVARNIVPAMRCEAVARRREIIYVGDFSEKRHPGVFVDALLTFNKDVVRSPLQFRVVGCSERWGQYLRARLGPLVELVAPTTYVPQEYSPSRLALVIDSPYGAPVYLATKAGEAIDWGNRVLFVTPEGSPARIQFDRGLRSIKFCKHSVCEVVKALAELDGLPDATLEREIPFRAELMEKFRPENVAYQIKNEANRVLAFAR